MSGLEIAERDLGVVGHDATVSTQPEQAQEELHDDDLGCVRALRLAIPLALLLWLGIFFVIGFLFIG